MGCQTTLRGEAHDATKKVTVDAATQTVSQLTLTKEENKRIGI